MKNENLRIDIDTILATRSRKWSALLPRFALSYLKKVVHEQELNEYLRMYGHLRGLDFLKNYLSFFQLAVRTRGAEQIEKGKRYIFAGNHPIGSHDGILIIKLVEEIWGPSKSLINDLLLHVKPMEQFFVGVNKHGATSRNNVKAIDEAFNSDKNIIIFPSGLVSRKVNGRITDLEWKRTFISRAVRHGLDVVPVHISGRNSNFFYNFARLRELLGIRFRVEMLYLVDEMFNKHGQTLDFTFGKPISHTTFDSRFSADQWAAKVKDHVYRLPDNYGLDFMY